MSRRITVVLVVASVTLAPAAYAATEAKQLSASSAEARQSSATDKHPAAEVKRPGTVVAVDVGRQTGPLLLR
jgi:hypothetical protein